MDLKEMISNFESQYAQLIKEGNTHEAKIVDRAIKNAKSEMSKTEKASDSISPLTEKKNDSETQLAIAQQSASAAVADAPQQYSTTKPNSETDNLVVANHSNIGIDNPVLITRFIGLIHEDKFKTNTGYRLFMKVKNRLRTLIVNWLKMKVKRGGELKKNAMIDLSVELNRIAQNEVKDQFKEEILSIKFFVSDGKEKVFYGCDDKLINELFK